MLSLCRGSRSFDFGGLLQPKSTLRKIADVRVVDNRETIGGYHELSKNFPFYAKEKPRSFPCVPQKIPIYERRVST